MNLQNEVYEIKIIIADILKRLEALEKKGKKK